MADQSLQAFQLGASLFDRAQTQQRMMEQFKLQSAESLIQQRGMQLQNQIRDLQLADAIGEQEAQVAEFKQFSDLSKQVGDYLDNPKEDAKFPVVPVFKSKQFRLEADRMLNNLERYSARAKLLRATNRAEAQADAIAASTLNKAIELGAIKRDANGKLDIDVPLLNQRSEELRKANLAKTTAQTTGLIENLELARGKLKIAADNLDRLTREGAAKSELDKARFEFKQALDTEAALLNEKKFEFERGATTRKLDIEQQKTDISKEDLARRIKEGEAKIASEQKKFDFTRGLELEKLALEKIKVGQLGKRTDAYVQKILQPAKSGEIKLNAVDDRLVKKAADDIANKQGISDAIGYEIGVLDDPSIDEYVKRASAQNILKILNSAEGKDAVGVEESKRLGQFLEFQLNPVKGFATGRLFGTDLPRFVEQIQIKKDELDTRVREGMNRVNDIYRKYGKDIPAGTSQTPSRGTMITAPAPQAASSTNATVSIPSFKTIQEAKAAGVQPGARVIINGVQGTIK